MFIFIAQQTNFSTYAHVDPFELKYQLFKLTEKENDALNHGS